MTKIFFPDQVKVSFIQNKAKVKGAAVYISTLSACLWYEEYPFHSAHRAIRWNNTFEYRGNSIHPAKTLEPLQGPEYDIATDTHHFEYKGNNDTEIKVGYFFLSTNFVPRVFSPPRLSTLRRREHPGNEFVS